jgi:Zn-dependent peptidase ImmA (M78 family)
VQYSKLDGEISGMIYTHNYTTIIGINSNHHYNRQRFTLAHECGHYLLHRDYIVGAVHVDKRYLGLLRSDISSQGVEPIEIEANQFAAELLVPEEFLIREIEAIGYDVEDDSFISDLAKKFKVSCQMMSNCLANIRLH